MKFPQILILIGCLCSVFGFASSQVLDSEKNNCNCSKISDSAKIKCSIVSKNPTDGLTCTVTFDQANDDFSFPHTRCIDQNIFSTWEYPDQLRKIVIFCKAPYPLKLSFDGMMPHQSIGIAQYRYHDHDIDNPKISELVVSMDIEPEITGRYSILSQTGTRDGVLDFYIFVENGDSGPALLNQGKVLRPTFIPNAMVLPCRPFKSTTEILITKNSVTFTGYDRYDPTLGFVINLGNKDLSKIAQLFGEYQCTTRIKGVEDATQKTTILVTSDDLDKAMGETRPSFNITTPVENFDLNLNVSGKWVACLASDKSRKEYRLVNMRSRNPLESSMKKLCFAGNAECLGKREGSFSRCYSSPRICKAVDFKEGGGLISCFFRNSKTVKEPHHYILGLDGKTYLNPDASEAKTLPIQALMEIKPIDTPNMLFYTEINYTFTCTVVSYLFARPIMIDLLFPNGTRIPISERNPLDASNMKEIYDISSKNIVFNNYKIETKVKFAAATETDVICSAFTWNSDETFDHHLSIKVEKSSGPNFSNNFQSVEFIRGQSNELECNVDGLPKPAIEWEKDGNKIQDASQRKLIISNTSDKNAGTYSCKGRNELGQATKIFHVTLIDAESGGPGLFVTVGVPLLIILISAIVCGLLIKYYRRTRTGLSQAEINEFLRGIKTGHKANAEENEYESVISAMPYPKEYEVIDGNFNIDETSLLGSGAYGLVYKGSMDGRNIAIKTLKRNADVNYLRSLLTELKVMIYLKEHPNIVNLVGANTKHLNKGIVYVMVELCPLGNLENHLKNNRKYFINEYAVESHDYLNCPFQATNTPSTKSSAICILKTSNLLKWSAQIASAMEYLEAKNVIHGDLAARNVLLEDNETAKVSDFGLSRKMYEYSNYVKQSQEPLPWRYMALESLKDLHFSSKSDVWSYGVTLWEIFSLGEVPYPGFSWNVEFVEKIENGLRMSKAKFSNEDLFRMQLRCWNNDPEQRPRFKEIRKFLEEQLDRIK